MEVKTHKGFSNNSLVFHETELKWLTMEKVDYGDGVSVDLFDGHGILGSQGSILDYCRVPTKFIFQVAVYLEGYKTAMSQTRVLNSDTSRRFNSMVLAFVDK